MRKEVILSICGKQGYMSQEPETIELVTEGYLDVRDDGFEITYEETELTGMEGVTTHFLLQPGVITLTRTGRLESQMVFREGVSHDSLYQMEFGALMLTVCASSVAYTLDENGGTVDLSYNIEIEHDAAGVIDYHLDVKAK